MLGGLGGKKKFFRVRNFPLQPNTGARKKKKWQSDGGKKKKVAVPCINTESSSR